MMTVRSERLGMRNGAARRLTSSLTRREPRRIRNVSTSEKPGGLEGKSHRFRGLRFRTSLAKKRVVLRLLHRRRNETAATNSCDG